MIEDFCKEHGDKNLAAKTVERYRDAGSYIDTGLLSMPITEITMLHPTREWNRLRDNGGHHRKTKASRPLSGKTVRNIAGVVSSAFSRGIRWGLRHHQPCHPQRPSHCSTPGRRRSLHRPNKRYSSKQPKRIGRCRLFFTSVRQPGHGAERSWRSAGPTSRTAGR